MKKTKLLIALIATALLLCSCEKDETGQILTYYKHVTGEGYVFYKYLDGTISPSINQEVEVEAAYDISPGMGGLYVGTLQKVKTDANGKYSCRFVKKIDYDWDIKDYHFGLPTYYIFDDISTAAGFYFSVHSTGFTIDFILPIIKKANIKHPQIVHIDTIWLIQTNVRQ